MGQSIKKEQKRTEITKDQLLKQLEQNMGNVTLACHFGKCSRSTFYRYYETDIKFKIAVDDISEIAVDICESELWKQIKDGNVPCILFYLKTKGKSRGYVERQELTGQNGQPINWNETKTYAINESINKTDNGN
tara:strand:- start:9193 stop:9594 length:402 start_codon:yes stop_codon:yes gene_type:complete